MEVSEQIVALADVGTVHGGLFRGDMGAQCLDLGRSDTGGKGARHLGFQHAAHGEHLARLLHRRRGNKGAARGLERHQPVLRELEQGLAHQRARHAEVVGELLLGQLGARPQFVFDDGACQRIGNGSCGGGFHATMIADVDKKCIHFCPAGRHPERLLHTGDSLWA
ncbi:hypothetical protein D3C78_830170 [compost metagenome]